MLDWSRSPSQQEMSPGSHMMGAECTCVEVCSIPHTLVNSACGMERKASLQMRVSHLKDYV